MLSWDDFEEKEVKPLSQTETKSPIKEETTKSVSNEETLIVSNLILFFQKYSLLF